ncbi:MAG: two-component system response regulator, partial [Rheinheimera sp.]|nr:two-component system response regulator [Rheinheimera sp.]
MEFVRPLEPILIIDDVKQIRADLSQVLAGLGFDDTIECDNFNCAK